MNGIHTYTSDLLKLEILPPFNGLLINKLLASDSASGAAAKMGRIDILNMLQQINCPFTVCTALNAAAGGQLETLKWLRTQQCPIDDGVSTNAGQIGNFEIL